MTLCIAYIRQVGKAEELIFATDSELRGGGEKWDKGVKLFELPNKDGLICFTGRTARAYPLILNLINSINYEDFFLKRAYTLEDTVEHIVDLFSDLIKTITDNIEDIHLVRGEARFLFGGWDWVSNKFRIYLLQYEAGSEKFIGNELTDDDDGTNFLVFIGEASNHDEVEQKAQDDLTRKLIDSNRLHKKLDTEPLEVLRDIALNPEILGVGGSLQIAKVYRSNKVEFFGTYWPSSRGKPCFQGREYNEVNKPFVRYFDPDTFEIIESDLPNRLTNITEDEYKDDYETVRECYDTSGFLIEELSEKKKHTLRLIFKEVAYQRFLTGQVETEEQQPYNTEEE